MTSEVQNWCRIRNILPAITHTIPCTVRIISLVSTARCNDHKASTDMSESACRGRQEVSKPFEGVSRANLPPALGWGSPCPDQHEQHYGGGLVKRVDPIILWHIWNVPLEYSRSRLHNCYLGSFTNHQHVFREPDRRGGLGAFEVLLSCNM